MAPKKQVNQVPKPNSKLSQIFNKQKNQRIIDEDQYQEYLQFQQARQQSLITQNQIDEVGSSRDPGTLEYQNQQQQVTTDLVTKQFQNININVFGDRENPLFNAKQIGDILGIQKITKTIEKYKYGKEKILKVSPSGGGLQEQYFLTEQGLYKLVMKQDNNQIAENFQDWVTQVLKEIRLTGSYIQDQGLKQQLEKLKLENQKFLELNQPYIEAPKENHIYIWNYEDEKVYRIGLADDIKSRLGTHKSSSHKPIQLRFVKKCIDEITCEKLIMGVLRYQGYGHGKDTRTQDHTNSHFDSNLDYTIMIVEQCCNLTNCLQQCRQTISAELFNQKCTECISVYDQQSTDYQEMFNQLQEYLNKNKKQRVNSLIGEIDQNSISPHVQQLDFPKIETLQLNSSHNIDPQELEYQKFFQERFSFIDDRKQFTTRQQFVDQYNDYFEPDQELTVFMTKNPVFQLFDQYVTQIGGQRLIQKKVVVYIKVQTNIFEADNSSQG